MTTRRPAADAAPRTAAWWPAVRLQAFVAVAALGAGAPATAAALRFDAVPVAMLADSPATQAWLADDPERGLGDKQPLTIALPAVQTAAVRHALVAHAAMPEGLDIAAWAETELATAAGAVRAWVAPPLAAAELPPEGDGVGEDPDRHPRGFIDRLLASQEPAVRLPPVGRRERPGSTDAPALHPAGADPGRQPLSGNGPLALVAVVVVLGVGWFLRATSRRR